MNAKHIITSLSFTFLLTACVANRFSLELDSRDQQPLPIKKEPVQVKELQSLLTPAIKDNSWISYKETSAKYEVDFNPVKADCTNDEIKATNALFTLLTLGIIPYYEGCNIDLNMHIKNNEYEYEHSEHIGKLNYSKWLGWIAMFIPNKAETKNPEYFTQHIAYQLYNPNSTFYQEKSELDKEIKRRAELEQAIIEIEANQDHDIEEFFKEQKKEEELNKDIANMLNDLK